MRLTPVEIKIITDVLTKHASGEIYLHGSRIDDNSRGGDIDLFFVVADHDHQHLEGTKYKIEAEISLALNEQKIDLILVKKSECDTNSFFCNSRKIKVS